MPATHLLDLAILTRNAASDLIRSISDPEHLNMTLEELMVVSAPQVNIRKNIVDVEFTPTVPHCGASTLIGAQAIPYCPGTCCMPTIDHHGAVGLSIRVRLLRSLPQRYKVDIHVKPGSHQSEHAGTSFPRSPKLRDAQRPDRSE